MSVVDITHHALYTAVKHKHTFLDVTAALHSYVYMELACSRLSRTICLSTPLNGCLVAGLISVSAKICGNYSQLYSLLYSNFFLQLPCLCSPYLMPHKLFRVSAAVLAHVAAGLGGALVTQKIWEVCNLER